jgi:hypothetical protein
MMEAACSSEKQVDFYEATRCSIPQACHLPGVGQLKKELESMNVLYMQINVVW